MGTSKRRPETPRREVFEERRFGGSNLISVGFTRRERRYLCRRDSFASETLTNLHAAGNTRTPTPPSTLPPPSPTTMATMTTTTIGEQSVPRLCRKFPVDVDPVGDIE